MKQLAQRYPWIDIDRAGIYGHSGGGFATADAMFRYPDFFKVGISEVGQPRQPRLRGRLGREVAGPARERTPTARPTTTTRPIRTVAKNLKGKLLLAHGTMDDNVPPNNTLLVVDALIKANKDFDLLMLPNRGTATATSELHDAPPLGLLRAEPARRRAAEGVSDQACPTVIWNVFKR